MTGLEIKIARLKLGMNQRDFARKVGCTQNWLSQVERERQKPSKGLLARIRRFLESK